MRRNALIVSLAFLSACATTTPPPAEQPAAKEAAPAVDPFAGCTARSLTEGGFVLQCGTRMASLERTRKATPENMLESYFSGMRAAVAGDLRRNPVERVVGGQKRSGLTIAMHVPGRTDPAWSGDALVWADEDGTVRLVSCGARDAADRELCGVTFEALATATGLPQGIAAPERQQVAGWPPAMPEGCSAGPQSAENVLHAVCPESGANLVLMRLGDAAADPSRFDQALEALTNQTFEALKAGVSPGIEMKPARCLFSGADTACTLFVFPKEDEFTLGMLMAVGNAGPSAVVAQCTFAMEMGVPAECQPWINVAE